MIQFRDYKYYPDEIMEACQFRDEYDFLSNGAFYAMATELGLQNSLLQMTEWENENTDGES